MIIEYNFPPRRFTTLALGISLCLVTGCAKPVTQTEFDPGKCAETIPDQLDGLTILSGPRTKQSIIRNMVWPTCNAIVLHGDIKKENAAFASGFAVFKVVVEYTGEVQDVSVIETTLDSEAFLSRICDMIYSTDFTFWGQDITDTAFLYPIHFPK